MSGFYRRWWTPAERMPPLQLPRRRMLLAEAVGLGAAAAFGAWLVVRLVGVYVLRWCV